MQDWSKYIERPIVEVLPELEAEGYRVTSDECAIFGFRNIDIEKGSVVAEIVCVPYDCEEYQEVFEFFSECSYIIFANQ